MQKLFHFFRQNAKSVSIFFLLQMRKVFHFFVKMRKMFQSAKVFEIFLQDATNDQVFLLVYKFSIGFFSNTYAKRSQDS